MLLAHLFFMKNQDFSLNQRTSINQGLLKPTMPSLLGIIRTLMAIENPSWIKEKRNQFSFGILKVKWKMLPVVNIPYWNIISCFQSWRIADPSCLEKVKNYLLASKWVRYPIMNEFWIGVVMLKNKHKNEAAQKLLVQTWY